MELLRDVVRFCGECLLATTMSYDSFFVVDVNAALGMMAGLRTRGKSRYQLGGVGTLGETTTKNAQDHLQLLGKPGCSRCAVQEVRVSHIRSLVTVAPWLGRQCATVGEERRCVYARGGVLFRLGFCENLKSEMRQRSQWSSLLLAQKPDRDAQITDKRNMLSQKINHVRFKVGLQGEGGEMEDSAISMAHAPGGDNTSLFVRGKVAPRSQMFV